MIQSRSKTSLKDNNDNLSFLNKLDSKKKINIKISKSKSKNELLSNDNVDGLLSNMKNFIDDRTKSIYLTTEDN